MTTREKNREMFERSSPDTTAAAIRWLEAAKGKGDDRFFLWVHYQDPHGPYAPPPDVAAQFPPRATATTLLQIGTTNKGKGQIPRYQAIDGERDPEAYRARYDAEIRWFDQGFGRLIEWLRTNGWFDDALVVFTADHGESLGEHDYWFCHGENVYREVVRVPLIVHYPRGTSGPALGRSTALVGHLDLWPTLIGAFGLEAAPNRGVSLLGATLPSGRVVPQTMGAPGSGARWVGVTDEQYRLILPPRAAPQLYDVRADPLELVDLAASHGDVVESLAKRYQAFLRTDARKSLLEMPAPIDPEREKALEHLGYTDGDDPK